MFNKNNNLEKQANELFNKIKEYLGIDEYFYKRYEILSKNKWEDFPSQKGWEEYNWKEAENKLKKIQLIINQFQKSINTRKTFIALLEKEKFSEEKKQTIYQDWLDYCKYLFNYVMGYGGTTGYGVSGYGDLARFINDDEEYKANGKFMLVNLIAKYDQIKALASDSKLKISEIDDNLIKMEEIEKRLEKKLKS